MPGKELSIDNGEVRDVEGDKYYACLHCDAVRGTAEGMETHLEIKHSDASEAAE